jgi:hypothetical protein
MSFTFKCAHCGSQFSSQWRKKTCSYACAKLRNTALSRERDKKRHARLKAAQQPQQAPTREGLPVRAP